MFKIEPNQFKLPQALLHVASCKSFREGITVDGDLHCLGVRFGRHLRDPEDWEVAVIAISRSDKNTQAIYNPQILWWDNFVVVILRSFYAFLQRGQKPVNALKEQSFVFFEIQSTLLSALSHLLRKWGPISYQRSNLFSLFLFSDVWLAVSLHWPSQCSATQHGRTQPIQAAIHLQCKLNYLAIENLDLLHWVLRPWPSPKTTWTTRLERPDWLGRLSFPPIHVEAWADGARWQVTQNPDDVFSSAPGSFPLFHHDASIRLQDESSHEAKPH